MVHGAAFALALSFGRDSECISPFLQHEQGLFALGAFPNHCLPSGFPFALIFLHIVYVHARDTIPIVKVVLYQFLYSCQYIMECRIQLVRH